MPEGPCRAEKALMQLRDMDRRPAAALGVGVPPADGAGIAAEPPPPEGVGVGLDAVSCGGVRLVSGREGSCDGGLAADQPSTLGSGLGSDTDSEADSDSDSRTTLPPPYSSHSSFERPGV